MHNAQLERADNNQGFCFTPTRLYTHSTRFAIYLTGSWMCYKQHHIRSDPYILRPVLEISNPTHHHSQKGSSRECGKQLIYGASLGVANEIREPRPRLRPSSAEWSKPGRPSSATPLYIQTRSVVGRTCMMAVSKRAASVTWCMLRFAAERGAVEFNGKPGSERNSVARGSTGKLD